MNGTALNAEKRHRRADLDQGALVADLRRRMDLALAGLLEARAPVALLGAPDENDVGDSATYLGELAWLKQQGCTPRHVGAVGPSNWLRMERRIGTGAIILHPGGEAGDVRPRFQSFVEAVLWRYPGRPVIQLPQALRFSCQAAIDQAARVIERHGAFTLLVSDRQSYSLASRSFACDVRLCPDMAFALGPLPRRTPVRSLLMLLHQEHRGADREADRRLAAEHGATVTNWPLNSPKLAGASLWRGRARALAAMLHADVNGIQAAMWRTRAEAQLERGLTLLCSAEFIITDQVDAHNLCMLLGVPHCVVVARDAQTGGTATASNIDQEGVWKAGSVGEALALYRSLRSI